MKSTTTSHKVIFVLSCLCISQGMQAQEGMKADMLKDTLNFESYKKEEGSLKRWWNSLIHGNVDRTHEQALDLSFVVAPCYSNESGFGIGGAATALYRLDRRDSIMQPSDFTLSESATLKGIYTLTIKGNNHFRGNRSRLSYSLEFMHKPLDFWGLSYEACDNNPLSEYIKQKIAWQSDFVYKLTKHFHVGAAFNINYTRLVEARSMDYMEGQRSHYLFTGIGLLLVYDSRDFILNPKRGSYVMIRQVFYPKKLGSFNRSLAATTIIADTYQPLWKGGLLAFDLYAQLNQEGTPWTMREYVGSWTSRMRGYYEGRYVDCSQIESQLELRQHLGGRVGFVVWGGGSNVFRSFDKFDIKHTLPNYGLGLRVEFKHNANIRFDYGFGKHSAGFVCQFAEAF